MVKSVGIIGGGPSGLTAAKAALEYGLEPTIFERESSIGGLWQPSTGAAWPSMSTNLSRFTCNFSDYPWDASAPDFPAQPVVLRYLREYSDAFGLNRYVRLHASVTSLKRARKRWTVTWRSTDEDNVRSDAFDAIIVASGFFSKPFIPPVPGSTEFAGESLHSSQYRGPKRLLGKRVTIVGMAFSGTEIATELAAAGAEVVAVMARPMWILPRLLPNPDGGGSVPLDLVLYRRSLSREGIELSTLEVNRRRNQYFDEIAVNPGVIDPLFQIDRNSDQPPYVVIADNVLENVRSQQLTLRMGWAARLEEGALVLDDGSRLESDAVVWCTGYELDLPFLSDRRQELLGFSPTDRVQPLLLHKCTFHPDMPALAFVGVYRGPFFGVIELQARWACAVLSDSCGLPARDVMLSGIDVERQIRIRQPRPQFPHPDYVDLADSLAREIDVLPILDPSSEHYDWLFEGPLVPAHYRLRGPASNPSVALKEVERAARRVGR